MITVKKILMDYETVQSGIGHMPQFGWIIESSERNVKQEAYRLQIAEDEAFEQVIYDSGRVVSEESAHVEVEGVSLQSLTKYFVRVQVKAAGEESGFCTSSFLTAILDQSQWRAEFVSSETEADADNSRGTCVRKEFRVTKPVKNAYVCATALGLYHLYLNGQKVGKDEMTPGWTSYHKHLCYQTYEITELLKEGENAVGAMLGAGWYKGMMGFLHARNNYGKQTALLAQILIRYTDGTEEILATDASWKGTDSPVLFAEIYDGEIYDARKEIPGWCEAGLDETDWHEVEIIPYDKQVLTAQGAGKVAEMTELPAQSIFVTPQGDRVIDFGQNLTGWIHVRAAGKAGDVIRLDCFEVLDAAGNVYLDNLRGAKESFTYTFREEGTAEYHPSFTFMGFRYAKIVEFPGEPAKENFTAYAVYTNMKETGTFETSMPELNQLWHNILWGMKGNFLDIPTDCPQRDERLGWTGDAQIFCRTASYLMNTYTFYSKWLKDVAADQTPEGGVAHVVPDIIGPRINEIHDWLLSQGTHSAAAWADVAVINPWTMYLTFGDTRILKEQYASMKAWIDFMQTHAVDYIWNYKLQFGDWVALDAEEGSYFGATPNDLTCTAYFAYSTGLFVKIAKVLGREEDAANYQALYENIVKKFQETFFDAEGNLTAQTQTAHIVALYFGLTPEAYRETTVKGLLKLLEKENGHLVTGFVGTPYFCHALSQNGCVKEAYELLMKDDFPSWLYQVKMGATTIWEHWDGLKPDGTMWSPDMNSFNHYAYGAIGEWLFRVAAGLETSEEQSGYKHTVIYPRIGGGLTSVKAEYDSVYGVVGSHWTTEGDQVTLTVKVPVNTTAQICLDGAKEILAADGLEFTEGDGCRKAAAGSGTYTLCWKR
ncbi:MAG: family 78 glycoside hydrolase catalytic domain [Candidatus Limivivens sp.]|nr:family 78 glycoside hydrolase catalytic domain [Candidatus Limivivens sp.]